MRKKSSKVITINPETNEIKLTENVTPNIDRKCDGCTMCCQGWLHGEAYGKVFKPGVPCFYVQDHGCGIYAERPANPCVGFRCAWLANPGVIPEWMRPDKIKAIMTVSYVDGIEYLQALEAGERIDSRILNWMFISHLNGVLPNIRWQVDGSWYLCGRKEFIEACQKKGLAV